MRKHLFVVAGLIAASVPPPSAQAQGNLSTQGFGYPGGQLSTRALSLGGAPAETDPQSLLNPAAIALWGAPVLFMQYEPELRTVDVPASGTVAAQRSRTTTARFPIVGASVPLGRGFSGSISASSFLDRTWSTRFTSPQLIGDQQVDTDQIFSSEGGITDFRLAIAYFASAKLQLGFGGHVFSGENRVRIEQTFPDTVNFSETVQTSDISYTGKAGSIGAVWRPHRVWAVGLSARFGGKMQSHSGDSVLTEATVPKRFGAGVSYAGISGATVMARVSYDGWSSMEGLRRVPGPCVGCTISLLRAFDAWDYGVGADVAGPRLGSRTIGMRLGARLRTLPFGANGEQVRELGFGGGLGIPMGFDRAHVDLGIQRVTRSARNDTAVGGASESAYILSFGVRVRP